MESDLHGMALRNITVTFFADTSLFIQHLGRGRPAFRRDFLSTHWLCLPFQHRKPGDSQQPDCTETEPVDEFVRFSLGLNVRPVSAVRNRLSLRVGDSESDKDD